MEKKFSVDDIPLSQILAQTSRGELQLPDFQRGWVWDNDRIISILASISLSYPIGAVMTLATGNPEVKFLPRLLEGVNLDFPPEPDLLLLDGQQRLTSLYSALFSPEPVPTHDGRYKVRRHYYADINKCIDLAIDREEGGIVSIPEDRLVTTNFKRTILRDLRDQEKEIKDEMFPLDIIYNSKKLLDWQFAYVLDKDNNRDKWEKFLEGFISPFLNYNIPTIKLDKKTNKEAVCKVFEKVNTGGVTLTVFELLTATFAADGFNLREDWETREIKLKEQRLLNKLRSSDFLQLVTLITTYSPRLDISLKNPPPISCKRRDILKLQVEEYQRWADSASDGLHQAVEFLHGEHIFTDFNVPYYTQLVPLGAIFTLLGEATQTRLARSKLRKWFWCGVLGEMYGGSTETRIAFDLPECIDWITNGGDEPRTVKEAQFQAERLLSLRTRNSAAYKGVYALTMKNGACDFRRGDKIESSVYFDNNVDIYNIFPKRWCIEQGIENQIMDCIINKTPIGYQTSREIGSRAPSEYIPRLQKNYQISTDDLNSIICSHYIDPKSLLTDDFPAFFNNRLEQLVEQIEKVMGKPVNRSPDRDESPFTEQPVANKDYEQRVQELIAKGESKHLEFKSTGRKNLYTGHKDPEIEWSVVKSIAAFMNTQGGDLLIGIDDHGKPIGIEEDYPFVRQGRDGWEQWLTNLIGTTLGVVEAAGISVHYCELNDKTIACVETSKASKPVFAEHTKSAKPSTALGNSYFFVRLNNKTVQLSGDELIDYTRKHWPQ